MNRAIRSLPTPLSPVMSTLAFPAATRAAAERRRSSAGLLPTSFGSEMTCVGVGINLLLVVGGANTPNRRQPAKRVWGRRAQCQKLCRHSVRPGQIGGLGHASDPHGFG